MSHLEDTDNVQRNSGVRKRPAATRNTRLGFDNTPCLSRKTACRAET